MNQAPWVFALASVAVVTTARTARALGPVDVESGAKVGGATSPYSNGGAINPFGFGIGGRAGIVLLDHLYAGVNVMYYFGSSGPATGGPRSPSRTTRGCTAGRPGGDSSCSTS